MPPQPPNEPAKINVPRAFSRRSEETLRNYRTGGWTDKTDFIQIHIHTHRHIRDGRREWSPTRPETMRRCAALRLPLEASRLRGQTVVDPRVSPLRSQLPFRPQKTALAGKFKDATPPCSRLVLLCACLRAFPFRAFPKKGWRKLFKLMWFLGAKLDWADFFCGSLSWFLKKWSMLIFQKLA